MNQIRKFRIQKSYEYQINVAKKAKLANKAK